ncbi:MAG: recombination mediator RecR [Candidatus Enterosoma sp.]|nr:recombination mediator RecR [Candidatus Enterosoma sp.]
MEQIKTVQDLIECYKKLPGVGYRTAERLAYATLNLSKEDKDAFIEAFEEAETKVKKCPNCGTYYDEECPICSDPKRDKTTLLVVKDSKDILSIEKTNGYKGGYFTLKGTLSPLKNRNPEDIGIPELKKRVEEDKVKEIILALPTDLEGETTSLYIASLYKKDPARHVSKLANGIPMGTNLEYLDNLTITSSLKGRIQLNDKGDKE